MKKNNLKNSVKEYWNQSPCGTEHSSQDKYSQEYFEEIENHRYKVEPEIFSFAQFTRFHNKKILEVGTGAGTDFLQWARVSNQTHGIDLTPESIKLIEKRLSFYNLSAKITQADAEHIPYPDNTFDLVYSWGVIHHSPDTPAALKEIIRVTKPGGSCKIMIYNRHSLVALYIWIRHALCKLKPWRSLTYCFHHHLESKGTKAFTTKEVKKILAKEDITNLEITPIITHYDLLKDSKKFYHFLASKLAGLIGNRIGFFLTIEFNKTPKCQSSRK